MITADYSQIELRIIAEFSQDPKFLEAFNAGEDFHQKTADLVGIPRNAAKSLNFGLMYGMGPTGLAKQISVNSEDAQKFIQAYFEAFPKVKRCLEDLETKPFTVGHTTTPLGRKRYFRDVTTMREHGVVKRQGRNTPIQATCGDILKKAILLLWENFTGMDISIVNLVHDEIVVECPDNMVKDAAKVVEDYMVQAGEEFIKSVPVTVDVSIDARWKK